MRTAANVVEGKGRLKKFCLRGHERLPENLTKSGGCKICRQEIEKSEVPAFKDRTGLTYGELFVEGRVIDKKSRRIHWKCKCSCGNEVVVEGSSLESGNTRSCGHLHREGLVNRNTKHGLAKRGVKLPVELRAFYGARERCKASYRYHKNYLDRNIGFHFKNFQDWFAELGLRPSPAYSVDRRDNDLGYQKGNIRWSTRLIQSQNRSNRKKEDCIGRS